MIEGYVTLLKLVFEAIKELRREDTTTYGTANHLYNCS